MENVFPLETYQKIFSNSKENSKNDFILSVFPNASRRSIKSINRIARKIDHWLSCEYRKK